MDDLNDAKIGIENLSVELRKTDAYIQYYKPVEEYAEISKLLNFIMTSREERKRLVQYIASKKMHLNKLITDNMRNWPKFDKEKIAEIEIPVLEDKNSLQPNSRGKGRHTRYRYDKRDLLSKLSNPSMSSGRQSHNMSVSIRNSKFSRIKRETTLDISFEEIRKLNQNERRNKTQVRKVSTKRNWGKRMSSKQSILNKVDRGLTNPEILEQGKLELYKL